VLDYIDLLIEIGEKIGEAQYRLTMASEPGGREEGVFTLHVSEREVGSVLTTLSLGARLTRSLTESGIRRFVRGPSREQRELMTIGHKLFDGLTQSQVVRSCYEQTVQTMQADRNKGIRLRLVVREASLQAIPWELLHDGDRFLAVSGLTPMVRYVELDRPVTTLAARAPLRLLVATACPEDLFLLDVEKEQQVIEQALQKSRGLVETTFLHNASFQNLSRKLLTAATQGRPYHILHFIGHGRYRGERSEIVFEHEDTGQGDYIDGEELGNVLCRHRHLRLVVLNACEGARGGQDPFASVALSLLKAGIPAVVAMQFPISDQAATCFSDEFYYSLGLGWPVDVALGDARAQMYAIEGSIEFANPVLYMQAPDGKLFDVKDLPRLALESAEYKVEQQKVDKAKGDLGGKTSFKLNWEMIGALSGVASVIIALAAILISTGGGKPTPTPFPTPTLSPTGAVIVSSPATATLTLAPVPTTPVVETATRPTVSTRPPTIAPETLTTDTATPPLPSDTPPPTPTTPAPPDTPTFTPTTPPPKGKIAFVSDADGDAEIFVMDEDGANLRPVTVNTVGDRHPSWSPDGRQIVFTREGHGAFSDIYAMNADGSNQHPVVDHHKNDTWPAWSPRGEWIAFQTDRNGNWDIYLVKPDGTGEWQLTVHPAADEMPTWSAAGDRVFFHSRRGGLNQIYSVDVATGQQLEHHMASGHNYQCPRPSPVDGRLAFGSLQDGNPEIYIEVDGKAWRVTDVGSEEKTPVWSPDGKQITFVSAREGALNIYVVSVDDVLRLAAQEVPWTGLVIGPGNQEDLAWWRP